MFAKLFLAGTALAAVSLSGAAWPTTARAQGGVEMEIVGLHQLCNQGDRRACVRFGTLIGENRQRHADWRRAHADWFWWERL
jgi:hypothetical protein